jgi:hypothetical protein
LTTTAPSSESMIRPRILTIRSGQIHEASLHFTNYLTIPAFCRLTILKRIVGSKQ